MATFPIRNLKIANYKSIDSLEIQKLTPFTVFAGANGSGKSNFFDAVEFVGKVLRFDASYALRVHGGFENVRSVKRYSPKSQRFKFSIDCDLPKSPQDQRPKTSRYDLTIHDFHQAPRIEERFYDGGKEVISRPKSGPLRVWMKDELRELSGFADPHSALVFFRRRPLPLLLTHMTVYRVDPSKAKEPDRSNVDPTSLWETGSNLASVLQRLESDDTIREVISDWMETVVPGIKGLGTARQRIDQTTAVLFKEIGTRKQFPARLMSDGTIYTLCLLVAVLDRRHPFGITLIEEPERGLHPSAISEMVAFFRENASQSKPIWLTTHSESVVRQLCLEELVLVDKKAGRTCMKRADSGNLEQRDLADLGLDSAWLSNLLDGGIPW